MATLVTSSAGLEGGISDVRSFLTNLKFFALKFTPSTSYATGGDVIPAGSLPGGLKVADFVTGPSGNIIPLNAGQLSINGTFYIPVLDYANQKLKLLVASTGAEVANATNTQTVLGTSQIVLLFATTN